MSAVGRPTLEDDQLRDLIMKADEAGIRIEVVGGRKSWEFSPGLGHQLHVDRIHRTIVRTAGIETDCQCLSVMDVHIQFPDSPIKRPDISIFCRTPDEMEGFVTLVPKAVIEVISRGYEDKDLVDGQPLYLSQGVLDVVVFDPLKQKAHRFDAAGTREIPCPHTLELKCGCVVVV